LFPINVLWLVAAPVGLTESKPTFRRPSLPSVTEVYS